MTFNILNNCKKLSINWEVPEDIGQEQHLKHKEWVWETFTKRWSPHDTSALKIRTGLDDNSCCYISIKQCICISERWTTDTSTKENPKKHKLHQILLTNLKKPQGRKHKGEGKRKRLPDLRSLMLCLIKIDHCFSKIKCGS